MYTSPRSGWLVASAIFTWAASAGAHEGSHEHMPHQLTAGVIPLYVAQYDGAHAGLAPSTIDELNAGAIGVTVSYGYLVWSHLELRLRSEYIKPFPARTALKEGLHEFRGVVAASWVVPLIGDELEVAGGPEVGLAAWRLTEVETTVPDFEASHALGWTLSFAAAARYWVTHHAGFWGEIGFGVADAARAGDDGQGIAARWPLRLALGWADRF